MMLCLLVYDKACIIGLPRDTNTITTTVLGGSSFLCYASVVRGSNVEDEFRRNTVISAKTTSKYLGPPFKAVNAVIRVF